MVFICSSICSWKKQPRQKQESGHVSGDCLMICPLFSILFTCSVYSDLYDSGTEPHERLSQKVKLEDAPDDKQIL